MSKIMGGTCDFPPPDAQFKGCTGNRPRSADPPPELSGVSPPHRHRLATEHERVASTYLPQQPGPRFGASR